MQGHNTSSTSILVQWGDVPLADQNGIILSYTVTYKALPGDSLQTNEVDSSSNETTLTGLNEYTNYSITVSASTLKGEGNVSAPIIVITDEDSMFARCSVEGAVSPNSVKLVNDKMPVKSKRNIKITA